MAAEFSALLSRLLSANNDDRRAAEKTYFEAAAVNPDLVIRALLSIGMTSPSEDLKSMSIVLLRRLIATTKDIWTKVTPEVLQHTRQVLLNSLSTEPVGHVRHKLAHTATEVAITSAGKGCERWPELLQTIAALCQNADANIRETGVYLLARLCEYGGRELIAPRAALFAATLPAILQDPSTRVQVHALDATVYMVLSLSTDAERATLQPLVPMMLNVLTKCLATDVYACGECLKTLVVLVQDHPMFFRRDMETCVTTMIQITNLDTESFVRAIAMEFLTSLAEVAGATMRKMPGVVQAILSQSLKFLCLVDEDPSWTTKDEGQSGFLGDEDETSDPDLVSQTVTTLDRLSMGVGGKTLWPIFSALANPYLQSTDWRARRAGLIALSLVTEGCKKVLLGQVRAIVQLVAPFVRDPHIRVVHAAVRCMSQFISDFMDPNSDQSAETVVNPLTATSARSTGLPSRKRKERAKKIHEAAGDLVLPMLISAGSSAFAAVPRVRSVAASALAAYLIADTCSPEDLHGQALAVIEVLYSILREVPSVPAKISALTGLGSIAQVLDSEFVPQYRAAVTLVEAILTAAQGPEAGMLRGRAIECFSMIAEAVGREVAGMDAARMLNSVLTMAKSAYAETRDPDAYEVLMQAVVRLGGCLQADFMPYLAIVLPFIAEGATREVRHATVEADDSSRAMALTEEGMAVTDVKLRGMKPRKLALDAVALANKFVACMALANLVDDMGVDYPGFWPFTEKVTELLASNLTEPFASIRETCGVALVNCLYSALADVTDPSKAQRVFDVAFKSLLAQMVEERDVEVLYTFGEALSSICRIAHESVSDGHGVDAPIALGSASPPFGSPGATAPTPSSCARAADGKSLHSKVVLPLGNVPILCQALKQLFTECEEDRRQVIIREYASNVDADEEHAAKLEAELQADDELMSNYTDIIGYFVKVHGAAILPAIPPEFSTWLMGHLVNRDPMQYSLRLSAICFADDLIQFASPGSHVLLPTVLPVWADGLRHPRPALRQACAYGVGVAARHAASAFAPHVNQFVPLLVELMQRPDARTQEVEGSTDNVVSALLYIAKHMQGAPGVDAPAIMRLALAYLPIREDGDEARIVHGSLVDGLQNQEELWIGPGGSNVPHLLRILADALAQHKFNTDEGCDGDDEDEDTGAELFTEATLNQLTAVFQAIKANASLAPAVAGIVRSFKPKQQTALADAGLAF